MFTKTDLHIPGAQVRLGDRVRDKLTGFTGIATAHIRNLTGCDGVWVQNEDPTAEKESRERHFDVMRLERVEENPLGIKPFPKDVPPAG